MAPVSALAVIREKLRQAATNDSMFLKNPPVFFELVVPQEVAIPFGSNHFLFPLILSPESYELDEPFAFEATITQGSGLYVEESGIIERTIRLEGTTGFKPRSLHKNVFGPLLMTKPEKRSYARRLWPITGSEQLSGHKHFQYLQDAVFRTYADLKRDPATSQGTHLFFHVPKDDEHWQVVPKRFQLRRDKGRRLLYRYSIELLVVDKAEAVFADFSEDRGILGAITDGIRMIKSAVDLMAGAVNDLTALVADIRGAIQDIVAVIDSVAGVIAACSDFIDGVTELIETPYAVLDSIRGVVDEILEVQQAAEDLGTAIEAWPETVKQKFQQINDGLDRAGIHPELFVEAMGPAMKAIRASQELSSSVSSASLAQAASAPAPTTLAEAGALGTGLTPGDVISAKAELGVGRLVPEFSSTRAVPVEQGDTLSNLAARFLGDARLWQHIAVANGLKPPFLVEMADQPISSDDSAAPGTLQIGDKIQIPSFSRPPQAQAVIAVVGVLPEEPPEHHLLGVDIALEIIGGRPGAPLYDIKLDSDLGLQDVATTRGVENLAQGLLTRVLVDRGSDTLYRGLGVERIVGLNNSVADLEIARYRFTQAIQADPRVASIRSLKFVSDADILAFDVEVEVRNYSDPVTLHLQTK